MDWTPELDARLRELYLEHGARGAARVMGLSSGQVIGRAGRIGLSGHAPHLNGGYRGGIASSVAARERRRRRDEPATAAGPVVDLPLRRTGCAYIAGSRPYGVHSFCGDLCQPGSSYCEHHHRLTHTGVKVAVFVPPAHPRTGRVLR